MKMNISNHGDSIKARLRESLVIQDILESRTQLLDLLTYNTQIIIDLVSVEEMDTAGLQLLLFLKKEATKQGKSLQYENPSESVREVLCLLHLADFCDGPLIYSH